MTLLTWVINYWIVEMFTNLQLVLLMVFINIFLPLSKTNKVPLDSLVIMEWLSPPKKLMPCGTPFDILLLVVILVDLGALPLLSLSWMSSIRLWTSNALCKTSWILLRMILQCLLRIGDTCHGLGFYQEIGAIQSILIVSRSSHRQYMRLPVWYITFYHPWN